MYKDIWKIFNVTTVLIVPLLDEQTIPLLYKHTDLEYPFILAALEHGLENGYLGVRQDEDVPTVEYGYMYLLFRNDLAFRKLTSVSIPHFSFNELLIDSPFFDSIQMKTSEYIVYKMTIDPRWETDIRRITDGKYSTLSKRYREEIRVKQARVPTTNNPLFEFLISSNMAYFVTRQDKKLSQSIGDFLNMRLPKDAELFKEFNPDKETLDISSLTKKLKTNGSTL